MLLYKIAHMCKISTMHGGRQSNRFALFACCLQKNIHFFAQFFSLYFPTKFPKNFPQFFYNFSKKKNSQFLSFFFQKFESYLMNAHFNFFFALQVKPTPIGFRCIASNLTKAAFSTQMTSYVMCVTTENN